MLQLVNPSIKNSILKMRTWKLNFFHLNKQSKINFPPCCFYRYKINNSFWVVKEVSEIVTNFNLMAYKFSLI